MSDFLQSSFGCCRDHIDARRRAVRFRSRPRKPLAGSLRTSKPHAGKTDRLGDLKPFAVPTKTVSLRLNDLADTSVSLRIPSAHARNTKPPTLLRNQSRKPTLACEPVVSALTEVARLLQPGRCVT